MKYEILGTGSAGNAVLLNDEVLIDCGLPLKRIKPYMSRIKLVLLTHIHGDHFKPSTVKHLAQERPLLRFGCGDWMAAPLLDAGVSANNIDILQFDTAYDYGICKVIPVALHHNVPNCGYKIHFTSFPPWKLFYATDTGNLNGIEAKNYDLYMVEANYEDEEIRKRISEKKVEGEFVYETRVLENHLSKAKCDDFIYRNIGPTGQYVYMHSHRDDSEKEEEEE